MYKTVAQIKRANRQLGHHWFEPATVAAFGARVETGVIGGFYFVESSFHTRGDETSGRVFRVVAASPDGGVSYLDHEAKHETLAGAIAQAEAIVAQREA